MTTLKSITDYHEAILQRFLEYRQDNPYFNFNLRKQDGKKERLRNGYWFQGNDIYISASPFILGSYINKTPAIYICVEDKQNKFIDSEKVVSEFRVVRDETLERTDENLFNFLGRLLDDGELFPQGDRHIHSKNSYRLIKKRTFPSFDAVLNFLLAAIPKVEKIAAECGVRQEYLYLNADEFNKRYSKVADIKNGVYVKPEEDENTMESNNSLKSEKELLKEYYNFLINEMSVKNSTANSYKSFLKSKVAPMFMGEGNDKVKQLFNCPISTIDYFYALCRNKRNISEWAQATGNRVPSSALSKLINDKGNMYEWDQKGHGASSAALSKLSDFLKYYRGNPDTATPVVREKEKTEEEFLEEYYNFVRPRVKWENTAASYRDVLRKNIAPKFIKEGDEKVKQLFNCSVSQINEFYNSCLVGRENHEWNKSTRDHAPSGALSKLSDFLKYYRGNPDTVIHKAREKNEKFPDEVAPLNQIFYGPPGTGKTYNTTKLALDIIDGREVNKGRTSSEQKQRFAELQEEEQIEMVTFHQNFAYEDFIEGIKPVLNNDAGTVSYELEAGLFKSIALKADDDRQENFVLIIDEINRGNISKILGELITLIEPSKRLGNKDELKLALPYSKKLFGVPKNLYIIGTMNTADRSLAQLDTALRRRFNFIEMMPDSSRITETPAGVGLKQLLEAMNKQIAEIDSREHQIGHAYFMEVDSLEALKECFQQKVIPLLQEYFFDDWGKIQSVLNKNGFVFERTVSKEEDNPIYDLLPYDNGAWDKPNSYIAIYQSQSLTTDTTDEEE